MVSCGTKISIGGGLDRSSRRRLLDDESVDDDESSPRSLRRMRVYCRSFRPDV